MIVMIIMAITIRNWLLSIKLSFIHVPIQQMEKTNFPEILRSIKELWTNAECLITEPPLQKVNPRIRLRECLGSNHGKA